MTGARLQELRFMYRRVRNGLEMIEELNSRAMRITAVMDGSVRSVGPRSDGLSRAVVELMEQKREVESEVEKWMREWKEARKELMELESAAEREVLEMRYLCDRSWREVSRSMGLSLQRVYQLHSEGLKEMERREAERNRGIRGN